MPQPPVVLIVDDDPLMRQILARQFVRWGFVTAEAETNTEALAQALRLRPQLITTDMAHVGDSGLQLVEQIRASPPIHKTPIVLISGGASEAARAQAEMLGNTVTMWKPCTPADVGVAVERVFPRDQWGSFEPPSPPNPTG